VNKKLPAHCGGVVDGRAKWSYSRCIRLRSRSSPLETFKFNNPSGWMSDIHPPSTFKLALNAAMRPSCEKEIEVREGREISGEAMAAVYSGAGLLTDECQ